MIDLLKEMFDFMVIKKNASLIPHYYHPDMLLFTNAQVITYQEFKVIYLGLCRKTQRQLAN